MLNLIYNGKNTNESNCEVIFYFLDGLGLKILLTWKVNVGVGKQAFSRH